MDPLKSIPSDAVPERPPKHREPLTGWRRIMLVGSLIVLSLALSILLTRRSYIGPPGYEIGDIARSDMVIPMDLLIEDESATHIRREEAKAMALPVYQYNPSLPDEQVSKVKAAFAHSRSLLGLDKPNQKAGRQIRRPAFRGLPAAVRAELHSTMQRLGVKPPMDELLAFLVGKGFPASMEDQIILLLQDAYSTMPIPEERLFDQKKENIHRVNIRTGKVETVPVSLLTPLSRIRNQVGKRVDRDSSFAAAGRPHIRRILESLIVPNLFFDEAMTKSRQEEDMRNVDPVLRKLKKGKIVLRQGDEVKADHLAQIEALRKFSLTDSSLRQTAGMAFLTFLLLALLIVFARFITSNQWRYPGLAGFLLLNMTVNLLLLKLSLFVGEAVSQGFSSWPFNDGVYFFYLLPFAFGSMLVNLLVGEQCALLFTLFFCILAAQITGADAQGLIYILLINLGGIIFTRHITQRIGILGAGLKLGLSAAALFSIIQVIDPAPWNWTGGGFGACLAFLSGFINVVFLVSALPLCERLFKVTTDMRLSELGNLNLALIRDLIRKAPGTYNHSIAVGTLCERAAQAVGINPLFLRIASLYHDIGKTVRPHYFVENQREGNPHDGLDPLASAQLLQDHVTEGVSLAKSAHLPSSIVEMIPQHHGTRVMHFFHEKARKEAAGSGGEVKADLYRYAGPKPQTKASAILMFADCIEAASRTLNNHSPDALLNLVEKIITDAMLDGQLSECDITLSELNLVTYSFLETLSRYHHSRIAYPGFEFSQTD